MINILDSFREHQQVIATLNPLIPQIEVIAQRLATCAQQGGTIFWLGNGGSAADAQHLAAELIGRYKKERRAIASLALSTDTSVLTSLSNDYDYAIVFARQLEALCRPGDVVVGMSTSGNSQNIILAMDVAKRRQAFTVGMTGQAGGKLANVCDINLAMPSNVTARIQEAHILIGHLLCEWVENAVAQAELEASAVAAPVD